MDRSKKRLEKSSVTWCSRRDTVRVSVKFDDEYHQEGIRAL